MHVSNTVCIHVHVHYDVRRYVVTDWSFALAADFLFPCFFVFPPANPSNFSHCKCSGFPFFFSTEVLFCIYVQWWVERQEAVEVQDEKTGKMRRDAGRLIITIYIIDLAIIEFVCQLIKWQPVSVSDTACSTSSTVEMEVASCANVCEYTCSQIPHSGCIHVKDQ